jgi:hypothetical protein
MERGPCAVLAHTASRSALSEYARTTARTAPRRRWGTTPSRSGAWRVLGGDSRAYGNRVRWGAVRARAAPSASDAVLEPQSEQWSVFLTTRRVLGGYSRGTPGPVRGTICAGKWKGDVRVTRNGDAQSKSTRGGTANDTEYPTALGHCGGGCQRTHGHVRRGWYAHGSATVRARARRGAYGHKRAGALAPTRTARHRATRRAHRRLSSLSADSAAGIVPLSEFDSKDLRRAWFVPLCSEMRMHRSVPRTYTSTAPGCRMGERVLDTDTRGGAARAPSSCPRDERYPSRAAVRTLLPWYVYRYSKGH